MADCGGKAAARAEVGEACWCMHGCECGRSVQGFSEIGTEIAGVSAGARCILVRGLVPRREPREDEGGVTGTDCEP